MLWTRGSPTKHRKLHKNAQKYKARGNAGALLLYQALHSGARVAQRSREQYKCCFPVMRFFYVRLRTCAQYASMNEFTCCEHSVRIHCTYVKKTHHGCKWMEQCHWLKFVILGKVQSIHPHLLFVQYFVCLNYIYYGIIIRLDRKTPSYGLLVKTRYWL